MFRHILIPALAAASLLPIGAAAQPGPPGTPSGPAATTNDDAGQNLPQKIRDKLTAEGFKDVKVTPSSFVVSAKDKDGHPVTMLIGPTGMTVITNPTAGSPSTAQSHDGQQEIFHE